MAHFSENEIDRLLQQLGERHEKLLKAMRGTPIKADAIHQHSLPETHREVDPFDICDAVEDYPTVLKRIKRILGKGV